MCANSPAEQQVTTLDKVITQARERYPSEDGWIVINLDRLRDLLDGTEVTATALNDTPTSSGSLAEAIVSGNTAAALLLIGNRPMIALADAATELEALYRRRNGGSETVSDLLASTSMHLINVQLHEAVQALNSALTGNYENDTEAVRAAVLKAVSAVS